MTSMRGTTTIVLPFFLSAIAIRFAGCDSVTPVTHQNDVGDKNRSSTMTDSEIHGLPTKDNVLTSVPPIDHGLENFWPQTQQLPPHDATVHPPPPTWPGHFNNVHLSSQPLPHTIYHTSTYHPQNHPHNFYPPVNPPPQIPPPQSAPPPIPQFPQITHNSPPIPHFPQITHNSPPLAPPITQHPSQNQIFSYDYSHHMPPHPQPLLPQHAHPLPPLPPIPQVPHHDQYNLESQYFHFLTTPRPKTTTKPTKAATKATPKPFEFEISAEDLFYLSQIQTLLQNKSSSIIQHTPLQSGNKKTEDGPVFYGGVFDLEDFAKLDGFKDLFRLENKTKNKKKKQKNKEYLEDRPFFEGNEGDDDYGNDNEDDDDKRHGQKKPPRDPSSSDATEYRRKIKPKDKKRKKPERQDYEYEDDEAVDEAENEDEEASVGIGSTPTSVQLSSKKKKNKSRSKLQTTLSTSTTVPPHVIGVYANPYPYPYPYSSYPYHHPPSNPGGTPSASQSSYQVAQKPSSTHAETPAENHNVININVPDLLDPGNGNGGRFSITSHHDDKSGNDAHHHGYRRVSFGSMANGLVRKAVKSIVYRVFPTLKSVKGIAARGCRDVQSIGSFDSIIMPLGLAVTLHPLLLPLVPFLLLALGSIKAIESATCFVSEYFR